MEETLTGEAVLGEARVGFGEIRANAARAASGLWSLGLGDGGAVAILLRNDIAYLEALLACGLAGSYAVPVNWHFKPDEIAHILQDSGAGLVVVHADLLPLLEGAVPADATALVVPTPAPVAAAYGIAAAAAPAGAPMWQDWLHGFPAWGQPPRPARGTTVYTSGTTGRPKGVRRAALEGEARRRFEQLTTEWFGLRPGLRTVMAGPMYHSAPNTYSKAAMIAGGNVVIMPRFDAEELLRVIERERITHLHLVPTMFVRLLRLPDAVKARYDLGSLEFVIHGAAPCPPDVKRRMIEWWGPVIHEYYASTELGMVSRSNSPDWLERPGTVGRAWPGRRVAILDDDGRALGPGEVGEIYASLDLVPAFTYVNQEAERRAIERDGMVTNGDMGYLDADGYLFLCDRKRDMVISGGVNIYPAEIETQLITCPGVRDCAVFGVPDEEFGEALAAVIEPDPAAPPPTPETIAAHLAERLARYKLPKLIRFTDRLPRDESGKLLKRTLKEPYWINAGRRI